MKKVDFAFKDNMRIRLDYNNMMSEFVGEFGISENDIKNLMYKQP